MRCFVIRNNYISDLTQSFYYAIIGLIIGQ
jgi:hypothetical protein